MKLLLDESIPRQLGRYFPGGFEVRTVSRIGAAGLDNGDLSRQAAADGFEALITADRNIKYQQDLDNLPIPVVVLAAYRTRVQDLEPLVPRVVEVLVREPTNRTYRISERGT